MKYKYLIVFPIPEPFNAEICLLMDKVSKYTKIPPPYKKLGPHITFHRPIEEVDEETIKNLTKSMVLQIKQTRVSVSSFFPFGKQYVVLLAHATIRLATLWAGITKLVSCLPQYVHGEFDYDNTLHITIAEKTSGVFDSVWPKIKTLSIEPMTIPVERIVLYKKPTDGGVWEKVEEYTIPE